MLITGELFARRSSGRWRLRVVYVMFLSMRAESKICMYIFSMNMRKGRCDLFSISDRLETQLTSEVFEKRIGYCPNLILILAIVCCSPSN